MKYVQDRPVKLHHGKALVFVLRCKQQYLGYLCVPGHALLALAYGGTAGWHGPRFLLVLLVCGWGSYTVCPEKDRWSC